MGATNVQTAEEYAAYEKAVADFFESEGIQNLSGGHLECQACGFREEKDAKGDTIHFTDEEECIKCGASREMMDEPYFSWSGCDCCGGLLGGNREHASGYNPKTKEIQEYKVCTDCIYYAEYGQLDDMTMMNVEESKKKDEEEE